MSNRMFVGRASELTPSAVRSLITLAIQKALELTDLDFTLGGVEVSQLPDKSWGVFLLAAGTVPAEPTPKRVDPEEEEWAWTRP